MAIVKLALLQLRTDLDRFENLQKVEDFVILAAGQGADVVCLPEMFSIPFMPEYMLAAMESLDGETVHLLTRLAAENRVNIMAGSFPENGPDGKCRNTALFIDRSGAVLGHYRKTHLFDVDLEGFSFRESDTVIPGDQVSVFDTEFGKVGLALCYDLRFPGLFAKMAALGAGLVFVPAAFSAVSGPLHWELLVRSRALDNQFFIAACSPASNPLLPYDPYGYSMLADPQGRIVASAARIETILYAEADLELIADARRRLPLREQQRPELYS